MKVSALSSKFSLPDWCLHKKTLTAVLLRAGHWLTVPNPTITTKDALLDVAQVPTEHKKQLLRSEDYTGITEKAKAILALPTWHSRKILQSDTLYFAAPKIPQLGCVRSLVNCYSFKQKPRTTRQVEIKQLVSSISMLHNCKIHTLS